MKRYLGLRDASAPVPAASGTGEGRLFGLPPSERNFVRVRR
jgi:hypothetical protein